MITSKTIEMGGQLYTMPIEEYDEFQKLVYEGHTDAAAEMWLAKFDKPISKVALRMQHCYFHAGTLGENPQFPSVISSEEELPYMYPRD